jgi:flagellar assembly factor FliW
MKKTDTSRFGKIEFDETQALSFPEGLLGFTEYKEYILLEHKPGSPFMWLQSLESPDLAFVITNPFLIKKDYLENLSPEEEALIQQENDIIVFSLVTIPHGKAEETTINLLGPIVIDTKTRQAKQVILANSGYSHCHPMFSA